MNIIYNTGTEFERSISGPMRRGSINRNTKPTQNSIGKHIENKTKQRIAGTTTSIERNGLRNKGRPGWDRD